MSDLHIPDEAIAAQRAYDAADARVQEIIQRMPSGVAVAAGEAVIDDGIRDELAQARLGRLEAMERLRGLPWWGEVESPLAAEAALRRAARP